MLDEKSHENIFIYDISNKFLIRAKPLPIRFDKVDRFVRAYDGATYLALFGPEKWCHLR